MLQNQPNRVRNLLALSAALVSGALYGCSIHLIEATIPSILSKQQPLNAWHVITFAVFMLLWLIINVDIFQRIKTTKTWARVYMALVNGSQPHPQTVTSIRQTYQCK